MAEPITLNNPLGISDEIIKYLQKDFQPMKKSHADFPARALRYVVDGTDEDILNELPAAKPCVQDMSLGRYLIYAEWRRKFLEKTEVKDAGFYTRLALLYNAVVKQEPH